MKKITIYVFILNFIISTTLISVVIYFFLIEHKENISIYIKVSSVIGLIISTMMTLVFYKTFKLYDKTENLISDICVENKNCIFKTLLFLVVHFDFVKDKLKTGFDKSDICKNDETRCDTCTRETCTGCIYKKGDKK